MQAELVARAQCGDREAFSDLATSVAPRLHATARLILGQPDRADDAVQDALVEAWRDLRGLRDPERLDAWLHRLLVRSCQRHAIRERRRWLREIPMLDIEPRESIADSTGSLAERDEMERAFRHLTTDQRTILTLAYYADLSLPDVSTALGIPVGTTKSRLNRALSALRAAIAADERHAVLADGRTA